MLLSSLILTLITPTRVRCSGHQDVPPDAFHESLTLHPLPDGKLSVLFEFTTHFSSPFLSSELTRSHHSLTPPSLLLPLGQNDVAELTVSFTSGQWDRRRSGQAGPLAYDAGGGGGEVRGWIKDYGSMEELAGSDSGRQKLINRNDRRRTAITHALGGLFCAGLGPSEEGEVAGTFGAIFPPHGKLQNYTHFFLPRPTETLCTENLTPFLSLLPSKGLSGLSSLLAQPGIIFSWGFKTEGIEVIMPMDGQQGQWRGWWEGVVDLIPVKGRRDRAFSISRLFHKTLPRPFVEADSSIMRLILPAEKMSVKPSGEVRREWVDGQLTEVMEWDLLDPTITGEDVTFTWDGEGEFQYPWTFHTPPMSVSRTATDLVAQDGTFLIRVENHAETERRTIYSELWPQWVKPWLHEISLYAEDESKARPDLLTNLEYHPAYPPRGSTTTLHFHLTVPAHSVLLLRIPFTKLTLKYTEHRPDAERGREIPSGILTLLDVVGEDASSQTDTSSIPVGHVDPRWSGRKRIYTSRLLLDVPTPDFSMPYNVIIMSCTVMAVFFGLMQGTLTRRVGFVEVPMELAPSLELKVDDTSVEIAVEGLKT
ncbi:hypothetical protein M231_00287 [Tremella mesenterica]|uniref:Phosphatidylinositol glycan, class T n=1 Tax=Tremella mesenterica TaxID=5217 RepID=A0A4V1M516_TREME|nr:hypothetical protein M231_00287 [Tremella mesenterica]